MFTRNAGNRQSLLQLGLGIASVIVAGLTSVLFLFLIRFTIANCWEPVSRAYAEETETKLLLLVILLGFIGCGLGIGSWNVPGPRIFLALIGVIVGGCLGPGLLLYVLYLLVSVR